MSASSHTVGWTWRLRAPRPRAMKINLSREERRHTAHTFADRARCASPANSRLENRLAHSNTCQSRTPVYLPSFPPGRTVSVMLARNTEQFPPLPEFSTYTHLADTAARLSRKSDGDGAAIFARLCVHMCACMRARTCTKRDRIESNHVCSSNFAPCKYTFY